MKDYHLNNGWIFKSDDFDVTIFSRDNDYVGKLKSDSGIFCSFCVGENSVSVSDVYWSAIFTINYKSKTIIVTKATYAE